MPGPAPTINATGLVMGVPHMDCASDGSITPGEAEPHHRLGSFPVPFSLTRRPRGSPVVHRSGQRKAADPLDVFVDTLITDR
jgi:hypothetical protein